MVQEPLCQRPGQQGGLWQHHHPQHTAPFVGCIGDIPLPEPLFDHTAAHSPQPHSMALVLDIEGWRRRREEGAEVCSPLPPLHHNTAL